MQHLIGRLTQALTQHAIGLWRGWGIVFLLSLGLRLWGLGRFNTLVFDEVYFANFAAEFLQGRQAFGGHPPLDTYLIAVGIWVGEWVGLGDAATRNSLTGMHLSTLSYRWLNAVTGAVLPLVAGAIALQLTHRRGYALVAAVVVALDGLFLVESRYALNNVYLVLFGLVGHLGLLLALNRLNQERQELQFFSKPRRWWVWLALTLAGVGFGASIAVKWNGAGFWLGAIALWGLAWALRLASRRVGGHQPVESVERASALSLISPLAALTRLSGFQVLFTFGAMPALTYYLLWLPYMRLDPTLSFWQWQTSVLDYHNRVGGAEAHPYCSDWLSWLWMQRPIAYFYQTAHAAGPPPPIVGPPLPATAARIAYDVHAMGNPVLWWLSTLAVLALALGLGLALVDMTRRAVRGNGARWMKGSGRSPALLGWAALFLVVNWVANWLPWASVSRCLFLYHYMPSLLFSMLAIALLLYLGLASPHQWHRVLSLALMALMAIAFVYWLPLYLGLPLSPSELADRRWFPSWI
ncbi:MAG: phospholipid carrier-dependent glycosyltransferase [Kaiparowitsia implicata GSE-PSE-MK54-09C]|nr:phospholipid carrier-dependent glycosyltransferase [Kaiparowitsia implicata GSE-PSE-MK54-09C]